MIVMVATWGPLQKQWGAEAARLSSRDQTGAADQELQLEQVSIDENDLESADDSGEVSRLGLDREEVAEAAEKVLETPVKPEDQIVTEIVTTGNAMLGIEQEEVEEEVNSSEESEKNDEI